MARGAAPDDAATLARRGGRDWLSLALLQARNELLARLALLIERRTPSGKGAEGADAAEAAARAERPRIRASDSMLPGLADPLRLAARAGCFQEWWVARHVQRARGEAADAGSPRLPGIEARAEGWLRRADGEDADAIRHYLGQSLEQTLELLGHAEDDETGLYFFRLALQHEDRVAERLGHLLTPLLPAPRPQREALGLPAQRWRLGSERIGSGAESGANEGADVGTDVGADEGADVGADPSPAAGAAEGSGVFTPHGERWAHEVAVPEFEIDAQCVNWAQYAEFAGDGGYDRRECWSDAGWAWLQKDGRRAPRDVEQLAGSVLVSRAGQLQRAPLQQAAMQVTRHEAEAWCRWAGRRLPTEPEWELAAHVATRRGFVWGDVLEWVAGSARLFPGAEARVPPGTLDAIAAVQRAAATSPSAASGAAAVSGASRASGVPGASGTSLNVAPGVLRGCTSATPARWRHPKARRFALPDDDRQRSGFRSCAL